MGRSHFTVFVLISIFVISIVLSPSIPLAESVQDACKWKEENSVFVEKTGKWSKNSATLELGRGKITGFVNDCNIRSVFVTITDPCAKIVATFTATVPYSFSSSPDVYSENFSTSSFSKSGTYTATVTSGGQQLHTDQDDFSSGGARISSPSDPACTAKPKLPSSSSSTGQSVSSSFKGDYVVNISGKTDPSSSKSLSFSGTFSFSKINGNIVGSGSGDASFTMPRPDTSSCSASGGSSSKFTTFSVSGTEKNGIVYVNFKNISPSKLTARITVCGNYNDVTVPNPFSTVGQLKFDSNSKSTTFGTATNPGTDSSNHVNPKIKYSTTVTKATPLTKTTNPSSSSSSSDSRETLIAKFNENCKRVFGSDYKYNPTRGECYKAIPEKPIAKQALSFFDFQLLVDSAASVSQGGKIDKYVVITTLKDPPEYVKLSATKWPGIDVSFYPNPFLPSDTKKTLQRIMSTSILTTCDVKPGLYPITITGSTIGKTFRQHQASINLTVKYDPKCTDSLQPVSKSATVTDWNTECATKYGSDYKYDSNTHTCYKVTHPTQSENLVTDIPKNDKECVEKNGIGFKYFSSTNMCYKSNLESWYDTDKDSYARGDLIIITGVFDPAKSRDVVVKLLGDDDSIFLSSFPQTLNSDGSFKVILNPFGDETDVFIVGGAYKIQVIHGDKIFGSKQIKIDTSSGLVGHEDTLNDWRDTLSSTPVKTPSQIAKAVSTVLDYCSASNGELSLACYRIANEMIPNEPKILEKLALAYAETNDPTDAAIALESLYILEKNPALLYNIAQLMIIQNQPELATEILIKILEWHKDDDENTRRTVAILESLCTNGDKIACDTIDDTKDSPTTSVISIPNVETIPPYDVQKSITSTNTMPVKEKIPSWIKNNAKWWTEGSIDDSTFVGGLQQLIKEDVIKVPQQTVTSFATSNEIPVWVKTQTQWWANEQISEDEYLSSIEYLMKQGIINLDDTGSQIKTTQSEISGKKFTHDEFGFSITTPKDWIHKKSEFDVKLQDPSFKDFVGPEIAIMLDDSIIENNQTFDEYVNEIRSNTSKEEYPFEITSERNSVINGFNAQVFELEGNFDDKSDDIVMHFIFLDTPYGIYNIVYYDVTENFPEFQKIVNEIMDSFKILK